MSNFSFTVEGEQRVIEALQRMGTSRTLDVLEAALTAGAMEIANAARENCPKRSGTLARSITVVTTEKTDTRVAVAVGPQVDYGVYVEFGTGAYAEGGNGRKTPWVYRTADGRFVTTRGMQPRPYLRPAFDANRDRAAQVIARALTILVQPR